jgi:hypothetical protein
MLFLLEEEKQLNNSADRNLSNTAKQKYEVKCLAKRRTKLCCQTKNRHKEEIVKIFKHKTDTFLNKRNDVYSKITLLLYSVPEICGVWSP